MTATSLPAVGEIIADRLRIVRSIGAGGMGAVYEVEHTLTKHRRALKLLHGEYARSPGLVTRFLREASAAGRIGNEHVVETFDAGRLESGEPYIVMELLEGRTLADEIAERGILPVEETCDILLQACDGVRAAHAAGIVHRDLKPENLFLLRRERPFVKILDFGISKFDPELTGTHALTQEGLALGTPYYMPPEQVRGEKDISFQADVYALGVIMYECLTADKPFEAETLPHLAILIYEGRYVPPSARNPRLPPACDAVIASAMAGDRTKRYANIDEFARALESLQKGQAAPTRAWAAEQKPNGSAGSTPPTDAEVPSEHTPHSSVDAQTSAAFGQTRPQESGRSAWLAWTLLAGTALLLLAVGYWFFRGSDSVLAEPQPAPDTSPSESKGTLAARPSPPAPGSEPQVAPMLSAAPNPAVTSSASTPKAPPPRRAQPAPLPSSRARQLGLSEENPF